MWRGRSGRCRGEAGRSQGGATRGEGLRGLWGAARGGRGVGTSPLPDEVGQLFGGDGPLLHAVVQDLEAMVLLTLQGIGGRD